MKIQPSRELSVRIAAVVCGILLSVLLPMSAAAVEFTSLATIDRGLTYPTDVAVSESGRIFVVDGLAKKVLIYSSSYQLSGTVSTLQNPTAVAVFNESVYVADNKSKSVRRLTGSGADAGELKKAGARATFELPRNIAVDAGGNIYVVDQFADSIEVFDAAGNYSYTISGLSMPQDAVVVGGELFIIDQPLQDITTTSGAGSDIRLSRIRIFDLEARVFVTDATRSFPSYGTDTASGQYISLKGIAADPHNNIYLNDSYLNVLYKYDSSGQFLGLIGETVKTPLGATVSADGQLIVTSSYDGAVKVLGVDFIAGADTWGNEAPVADAGPNQTVNEGTDFILDGSGSTDADAIIAYQWTQKSGINVLPTNPFSTAAPQLALTAPDVGPEGLALFFELVVTDGRNKDSSPADTVVTVNNVITGSVVINDGDLYTNDPQVALSLDAPEAVLMRFANDGDSFGAAYYPYATAYDWTLSNGDGTKVVNVEFTDSGGNTMKTGSTIILDTEQPAVPDLIDNDGIPGEFNWQPVAGAVSYTLQYAFNADFTGAVVLSGLDYNGATIALADLYPGTWFWRVQAVDAAGNASEWSEIGTFLVGPDCGEAPAAPQLALPFDNAGEISRVVTLKTNAMIYAAECGAHLRTEWQISETADFSSLVMHVGTTMDFLENYQVPPLVLQPEIRYYWRVKFTAANGRESDWSETWSFTTAADYDEQGVAGVLYVQPEDQPGDAGSEEISIQAPIGDRNIRIKAVRVGSGVIAKVIRELDPDSIPDTINKPASFPLGLFSFRLEVEPGAVATITVYFSGRVSRDAEWYIYDCENGWHAYEGAVFSQKGKVVTLTFQDGGIGDTDGVVNGIIVNP